MITQDWAQKFAREWIEAWNTHDLERVLSHYTDDFEMSSQFIAELTGEVSGTLKAKTQVGAYWRTALERFPDLTFELLDVFTGVNSVTIYYRAGLSTVLVKLATEVFFIGQDGKVFKAVAHYN